jgi:hypothetical protein
MGQTLNIKPLAVGSSCNVDARSGEEIKTPNDAVYHAGRVRFARRICETKENTTRN